MPTCRSNGEAFFLCGLPELIPYRSGTVESRIRQLVMKLEYVDSLTLAHPFVKGFEQVHYCLTDEEVRAVAQGEISETVAKRKKEDIEGKENASTRLTCEDSTRLTCSIDALGTRCLQAAYDLSGRYYKDASDLLYPSTDV